MILTDDNILETINAFIKSVETKRNQATFILRNANSMGMTKIKASKEAKDVLDTLYGDLDAEALRNMLRQLC